MRPVKQHNLTAHKLRYSKLNVLSELFKQKPALEIVNDDLTNDSLSSGNEALEAAMRNASLLELSDIISAETNFTSDLKFIHKNIRFSIDIKGCVLVRQTRGMYWEYKVILEQHKFLTKEGWLKVPAYLNSSIETLISMKMEMSESVNLNFNEDDKLLYKLFNTKHAHFESFRYERGGALFIPSGTNTYSQYDKIYLSNVASIISYCVEKDASSRFLSNVYSNLQHIATQAKEFEKQEYNSESIPAAYLDESSGLPNQAGFLRLIRHLIDTKQDKFYVVAISLDKFTYFCNLFDETTKRSLLTSTTKRIQEVIKDNNSLSHISPSDLAFVLMETEAECVDKVINELLNSFSEDIQVNDVKVRFEICAGYSAYSACNRSADNLLKMANVALFRASQRTSQRFVAYKEGMERELKLHIELGRSIRQAISRNEFEVFFQPIVHVEDVDNICHFESLVRWMHPNEGMISPALFIEIAEASGDIIHLGYWVTERVCQHLARPETPDCVNVSINLSPVQIRENKLAQKMLAILDRYEIPPSKVTFEITETAAMLDPSLTGQRFEELKNAGFKLSLDDFGTGHSSLSYLLNFSFDLLKIDKSFIDQSSLNQGYAVIANSMIQMAHKLNMGVICEGIETQQQFKMVKAWGADFIQGYLISRPMPIEHFYPSHKKASNSCNSLYSNL